MAQPFLEAAVAGDDEGVVVLHLGPEARPQLALGDGQADGVAEALAERPGRDLDAGGVTALRMARGGRSPLPEGAEVVQLAGRSRSRYSSEYCRIDACPLESTNRSRSGQPGSVGSKRMIRLNST